VLVADDAEDVRTALGELLDGDERFRLVGSAGDATEAVVLALELGPDLAVVDVRMPGGGGVEACQRIRAGSPATCVVALSAFSTPSLQRRMAAAGAAAYLTKGAPGNELLDDLADIVREARS
jgi:DNA-binding NarL/FixJ family response regulator